MSFAVAVLSLALSFVPLRATRGSFLQPANLLVNEDCSLRICDFGYVCRRALNLSCPVSRLASSLAFCASVTLCGLWLGCLD